MGRFRLMFREELERAGKYSPFLARFEAVLTITGKRWRFWILSTAWNDKMTAIFCRNAINVLMSQNDVPSHLIVCDGKIGEYGGTSCRKRRQKGEKAQVAEKSFTVHFQRWII